MLFTNAQPQVSQNHFCVFCRRILFFSLSRFHSLMPWHIFVFCVEEYLFFSFSRFHSLMPWHIFVFSVEEYLFLVLAGFTVLCCDIFLCFLLKRTFFSFGRFHCLMPWHIFMFYVEEYLFQFWQVSHSYAVTPLFSVFCLSPFHQE